MWRDAVLVAGKDLAVERRSRVALNQVVPYALVVLLLFGFAFDQDRPLLVQAAPGLFWLAVLFSGLLAVQRSFAIEASDGAVDNLRLSGLEPAGIFVGKAAAVGLQLLVVEVLLTGGVVVLFHTRLEGAGLLVTSAPLSTAGVAGAGVAYGALSMGLRVRGDAAAIAPRPRPRARCLGCHRGLAFGPGPVLLRTVGVGPACSVASLLSTWLAEFLALAL